MKKQKGIELPEQDEEDHKGEDLHGNSSPEHYDDHEYGDSKKDRRASHSDYDQDNDLIEIKDYGEMPVKTMVLTAFLLITGLGFVIASFVSYMNHSDRGKILTFLLFGIFLSIPGCYYSVYLFKAFRADSPEERAEILDEIPV